MLRLLVLALLVLVVWYALSALLARLGPGSRRPRPVAGAGPADGEALVRCATCGVLVPASRALPPAARRGAAGFCSAACRRAGADPG